MPKARKQQFLQSYSVTIVRCSTSLARQVASQTHSLAISYHAQHGRHQNKKGINNTHMRITDLWKKIKWKSWIQLNAYKVSSTILHWSKKHLKRMQTTSQLFYIYSILRFLLTTVRTVAVMIVQYWWATSSSMNQGLSHIPVCTAKICWPALTADLAEESDSTRSLIMAVLRRYTLILQTTYLGQPGYHLDIQQSSQ